jgi:hypothetical protein
MHMKSHTGDTVTSPASTKGTWTSGAAAIGFMGGISDGWAGGGSSAGRGTSTRPRSIRTPTPMSPQRS